MVSFVSLLGITTNKREERAGKRKHISRSAGHAMSLFTYRRSQGPFYG